MNTVNNAKHFYPVLGLNEMKTLCDEIGNYLTVTPRGTSNQFISKSVTGVVFKIDKPNPIVNDEYETSVTIENWWYHERPVCVTEGVKVVKSISATITLSAEEIRGQGSTVLFDLLLKKWVQLHTSVAIDSIESFDVNSVQQHLSGLEVYFLQVDGGYTLRLESQDMVLFVAQRQSSMGLVKQFKDDVLELLTIGFTKLHTDKVVCLHQRGPNQEYMFTK